MPVSGALRVSEGICKTGGSKPDDRLLLMPPDLIRMRVGDGGVDGRRLKWAQLVGQIGEH